MANSWFRMYSEWLDDEKVQMMSLEMQRHFVALLCLRCQQPTEKMTERQIAFRLRVDETFLKRIKETFLETGFINEDWSVSNWGKRQYLSDSSTSRVRKFRANKALKQDETFLKRDETQNVTAPDTEQIQNRAEQRKPKAASAFELPDWIPGDLWKDYEEMRRKIRKPMTPRARTLAVNTLADLRNSGHSPAKVLEQSIFKSWQGLFAPSQNGANGNGHYETWNERVLRESLAEVDER